MREILFQIFKMAERLWHENKTLAGNDIGKKRMNYYNETIESIPPIPKGKLDSLLLGKTRQSRLVLGQPLCLPPLNEDIEFIPFLTLDWKLNSGWSDICLKIEMYRFVEEGHGAILKSLGFRFEQEEPGSKHNYMHVQINKERAKKISLKGCPTWIPTTVPCIPTIAQCPVSLILCLLMSLYGIEIYKLFSDIHIPEEYWRTLKFILKK